MKTLLFATAFTVAALAAAPSFAQVSGYAGASVSHTEIQTPFGDADGETFSADGSLFARSNDTLGFQFDLSGSDADDVEGTLGGAAHVIGDMSNGRIGAFVAASTTDGDTLWGIGAEGQTYVNEQITVAGTLAYAKSDDLDIELVGVNGQGRYFVSDNFRVDANVGYADAQDLDVSFWTAGVGAEYQFAAAPVSLFGGYSHVEVNDVDISADVVSLGVRFNFGGLSLKQRDRTGASMLGLGALTNGLVF